MSQLITPKGLLTGDQSSGDPESHKENQGLLSAGTGIWAEFAPGFRAVVRRSEDGVKR